MKYLLIAIGFLTTIPVPQIGDYDSKALGRSTAWFPLVGLLMGGIVAGVNYGLRFILPLPVVAVLSTILWVALSGGLHLDGLADTCDGLFCAASPERRLAIMKDVHIGAFGVVGIVLALLAKAVLLYSLPAEQLFFGVPLAAVMARWILVLAAMQASARPGGLGDITRQGMRKGSWIPAALTMLILLGISVYFERWHALVALALAHLSAFGLFWMACKRLGGLTGDVFGFSAELVELSVLLAFCLSFF